MSEENADVSIHANGVAKMVETTIEWRQTQAHVRGVLQSGFLPEGGRVLVELRPLQVKPPGWEEDSIWVDLRNFREQLVLRSELWELPGGEARDLSLRTFLFGLCDWLRNGSSRVEIASDSVGRNRGLVDLVFWVGLSQSEVLAYLQKLRVVRSNVTIHPYHQPRSEAVLYAGWPNEKERSKVSHSASFLANWFTGNLIGQQFVWHEQGLHHLTRFSLEQRLVKTLVRRFNLTPTGTSPIGGSAHE